MRVHACLLIVGVLIWRFTITSKSDLLNKYFRKQNEKREQSILWSIQVENCHLRKERRFILLMFVKRYMLQVMLQQMEEWKKCYKTWMFKYKARLKQVQVLPLHVVLSLWSNSCFVWHCWRSKVDSTDPAEMVGVLEWQKGIEIEAGTFKAYRLAVLSSQ